MQQIAKGIWKLVLGEPEEFTPEHFRQFPVRTEEIEQIPVSRECTVSEKKSNGKRRSVALRLPFPWRHRKISMASVCSFRDSIRRAGDVISR